MEKIDQARAWQKDLKKDLKVFRCAIQRNFSNGTSEEF